MSNTCGFGQIKDGRVNALCIGGKTVIDKKRNINGKNATLTNLNLRKNANISGDLTVKGCITSGLNHKQIKQQDLPYIISEPGCYSLCENLDFSPIAPGQTAITIGSSDVVLDLCCHSLSLVDDTALIFGVRLMENNQNITIRNGTLKKFTAAAIFCGITNGVPQPLMKDLFFENLTIIDNGRGGDEALESPLSPATGICLVTSALLGPMFDFLPTVFDGITINNCNLNRNSRAGCIIVQGKNIVIENSSMNGTYLDDSVVVNPPFLSRLTNIYMPLCNNVKILNSSFNDCGTYATGIGASGMLISISRNIDIKDCQFNNISGSSGIVTGILAAGLIGFKLTGSQMNNIEGLNVPFGLNGFHLSDAQEQAFTSSGIVITDCQFGNMTANFTTPTGITPLSAILMTTWDGVTIDNCKMFNLVNNSILTPITLGVFVGSTPTGPIVNSVGDCENVLIKNCQVSGIRCVSFSTQPQSVIPSACGGIAVTAAYQNEEITGALKNVTIENNTVSDISASLNDFPVNGIGCKNFNGNYFNNVYVKNNNVSDIRVDTVDPGSLLLNGILIENIQKPKLEKNTVTCAGNGISIQTADNLTLTLLNLIGQKIVSAEASGGVVTVFFNKETVNVAALFTVGDGLSVGAPGFLFTPLDFNTAFTLVTGVGTGVDAANNYITYSVGAADATATALGAVTRVTPNPPSQGMLISNNVTDCASRGYHDTTLPPSATDTTNAYIKNKAFNNGTNYDVQWGNIAPLHIGTLSSYPTGSEKWYNLDLSL